MRKTWKVEDGVLVYNGKGFSLATAKDYGDFEMYVDWKIGPGGDSGIYLRGSPQVQIWDPEHGRSLRRAVQQPKKPQQTHEGRRQARRRVEHLLYQDGGRESHGEVQRRTVVDNVTLENYWDRKLPIFPTGQIELQHHWSPLWFKTSIFGRYRARRNDECRRMNDELRAKLCRRPRCYLCHSSFSIHPSSFLRVLRDSVLRYPL